MSKDFFTRKRIKIADLYFNAGQVPGLPKNPRFIKDAKFAAMCQSIREDPEYLEVREVLVYEYQGVNVVIGGEMRTRGAKAEGMKDVPCKVFPESTSVDKIRAYAIKDNAHYGEWDQDALANDWEAGVLKEWGVDEASWGQPSEETDYSDKNKEIDPDSFFDEMDLKFRYTKDQYMEVQERLNVVCAKQKVETKEDALLELLMFYERHGS